MDKTINQKRPSFFWQGVMIILPVAILAVVGLVSLRQDRLLAEQDAKEKGATVARAIAQSVGTEAFRVLSDYRNANFDLQANRTADLGLSHWEGGAASETAASQRIRDWQRANPDFDLSAAPVSDCSANASGRYSMPQIYPLVPQPPAWLLNLSLEQRHLWQEEEKAEYVAGDPDSAQEKIRNFLATKPPDDPRVNAELHLLLLKTRGIPPAAAVAQLTDSKWENSDRLSEAGLPVGQLIWYRALQLMPDHSGLPPKVLNSVAWAIAYRPSILSPRLIAEAERVASPSDSAHGIAALKGWWDSEDRAREVLRDFQDQHPSSTWTNGPFWVVSSTGSFLLVLDDGRPAQTYDSDGTASATFRLLMFPQAVVMKALADATAKADISVPPFAAIGLELGGTEFVSRQNKFSVATNAPPLPLLGDAMGALSRIPFNTNTYPFRVRVFLADRDLLYARQHQRTLLFGALIAAAVLAALAGFVTARRAFYQQHRLGEMKSNFVSSVSHELRAPIASMRLMAEGLERGKITEPVKQKEYFGFLVQESRRLTSLIENVLDFSRIDQGRKQYHFDPADLAALAEQTVQLMRPCAAERKVEIVLNAGAEHPQPSCDGPAIQQALINLIDNAIKHSPAGANVTVGLETADSVVRIWVEDTGPGIPPEEHEKIFERFYRRGSELRRETQGIGIGLTIVKHIVEAHHGRVIVRSAVGEGSRFTIELPLKP